MVTIVLVTGSGPKCPRKPYYTLLLPKLNSFELTQSGISVGRSYMMKYPYKLLEPKNI